MQATLWILTIGRKSGAKGWSFNDVEPYYRRLETWREGARLKMSAVGTSIRGTDGPIHVTRGPPVKTRFYSTFVVGAPGRRGRLPRDARL